MKKLNNYLDTCPLWHMFLIGFFFTGLFTFILFYFAFFNLSEQTLKYPFSTSLKLGATLGVVFGFMIMLMQHSMRLSSKFWKEAKEFETKINESDTKNLLDSLNTTEFNDLRKLAQGGPHYHELTRLHTIMKTKYQYVK